MQKLAVSSEEYSLPESERYILKYRMNIQYESEAVVKKKTWVKPGNEMDY